MIKPDIVAFTKVALPGGFLQNMSPHPVEFGGREWRTTEALFQALRFCDMVNGEPKLNPDGSLVPNRPDIVTNIWRQKSPMAAKMVTKSVRDQMVVQPLSRQDMGNMRLALRLKVEQHPELARLLDETGEAVLIEDCSNRMGGSGLFWGAALMPWGRWLGENHLGKLWMELRATRRATVNLTEGS